MAIQQFQMWGDSTHQGEAGCPAFEQYEERVRVGAWAKAQRRGHADLGRVRRMTHRVRSIRREPGREAES